jgi:hypothetical protein
MAQFDFGPACREGLVLATDLNLSRIKIASDCLEVINSLDDGYLGRFSSVTREIKSRASDFAEVAFVHERRSSNVEAHSLACSSISRDAGPHVWLVHTPDEFCIPMLLIDE